jgi:DNA-binding transcriptional ArsR family regulator
MRSLILFLLLLASPVYAAEISSYKIVGEVKDSSVLVDVLVVLYNDGFQELKSAKFSVPKGFEVLSVSDSYGEIDYTVSVNHGIFLEFFFNRPIPPGEGRIIIIKLKSEQLITPKEGYLEYLLVFTPRADISDFEHVLKLPKDAELYSPRESFPLVVPDATITYKENAPILTWGKELKANQPEVFLARYKITPHRPLSKILTVVSALIVILVFGFVGSKLGARVKKMRRLASLKILNEREREVLEAVIKNEGIKQYELQTELGYSKASLSKILAKLESRGLIRKKRFGKVNKIYIGEKFQ